MLQCAICLFGGCMELRTLTFDAVMLACQYAMRTAGQIVFDYRPKDGCFGCCALTMKHVGVVMCEHEVRKPAFTTRHALYGVYAFLMYHLRVASRRKVLRVENAWIALRLFGLQSCNECVL